MRIATATTALVALLASAVLGHAAPAAAAPLSACTPAPPAVDPTLPSAPPPVVTYPLPSSSALTKTTATLLASVDTVGVVGQVAFELGDVTIGLRCTAVQPLLAIAGPQAVSARLRSEKPGTTVHFRVVVTTAAGQFVGADQSFTTVASPARLAPGTTMLGIRVGYLTPAAARARVLDRFARPVVFTWHGTRWKVTPKQLGAQADVDGALTRALAGVGGGHAIPVSITVDPAKVARYVAYLDGLYSRPARVGSVTRVGRKADAGGATDRAGGAGGADGNDHHPHAREHAAAADRGARDRDAADRAGSSLHRRPARGAVVDVVQRRRRRAQHPGHDGPPCAADARGELRHRLAAEPVHLHLAVAGGNPYYYPPAHVRWAMYFFDNDFLHDSYEPAGAYGKGSNFGPYASHGCVHVPGDVMPVLYTTVPDHTPLIVVDA